jgi:hypothetical protein
LSVTARLLHKLHLLILLFRRLRAHSLLTVSLELIVLLSLESQVNLHGVDRWHRFGLLCLSLPQLGPPILQHTGLRLRSRSKK